MTRTRTKSVQRHHNAGIDAPRRSTKETSTLQWIILGLILVGIVALRMRLLSFPLERDEGAFAYMGRLLLQGVPPYTAAYDFKTPGLYAMYALFIGAFGQTASAVHGGLLLLNLISAFLLFLVVRKLSDSRAGLYAAAALGVLALSPSVLGFAAHATQFVVPAALAGTLFLLTAFESGRTRDYILAGIMLSLSFLMKQPAMFFVAFGFAAVALHHLINRPLQWKVAVLRLIAVGVGVVIPLAVTVGALALAGVLDKFWFWCFVYPSKYGTTVPLSSAFGIFTGSFSHVAAPFIVLWIFSGLGLLTIPFYRRLANGRWFALCFVVFSFIAVTPGYYFREHYFVVFLPAAALCAALAIRFADGLFARRPGLLSLRFLPVAALVIAIGIGILTQKPYFLRDDPARLARTVYGGNPFPEAVTLARVIESRTTKSDKIVVLGSEPQIYFYSGRTAASPYIFTYTIVEEHEFAHQMQAEMIHDIEREKPTYMVMVNVPTSWLVYAGADRRIFSWFGSYAQEHYQVEGIADIVSEDQTNYYWDEEARSRSPQSVIYLILYRRKAG
jgi:4-amino-4-deoxy-L-arabinose transferase-like glycosyltransferase